MRSSISAQSWASVPPAPAWTSTNALPASCAPAEHALEFEALDFLARRVHVAADLGDRRLVLLGLGQLEQVGRVVEAAVDALELAHHRLELGALPAERLGARRVLPDLGILQRLLDLGQPLALAIEVKETPGARWTARGDRG